MCEICLKLTIKTPERALILSPLKSSETGDFLVILGEIETDIVLVSLLLTLNRFHKVFWGFHC